MVVETSSEEKLLRTCSTNAGIATELSTVGRRRYPQWRLVLRPRQKAFEFLMLQVSPTKRLQVFLANRCNATARVGCSVASTILNVLRSARILSAYSSRSHVSVRAVKFEHVQGPFTAPDFDLTPLIRDFWDYRHKLFRETDSVHWSCAADLVLIVKSNPSNCLFCFVDVNILLIQKVRHIKGRVTITISTTKSASRNSLWWESLLGRRAVIRLFKSKIFVLLRNISLWRWFSGDGSATGFPHALRLFWAAHKGSTSTDEYSNSGASSRRTASFLHGTYTGKSRATSIAFCLLSIIDKPWPVERFQDLPTFCVT